MVENEEEKKKAAGETEPETERITDPAMVGPSADLATGVTNSADWRLSIALRSDYAATAAVAEGFEVVDEREQQKEGEFPGPNGSKIKFEKTDDGSVRPVSTTLRDGTQEVYKYEEGKLVSVTSFGPDKKEQFKITSEDGGETFSLSVRKGDKWEPVLKDERASVSVREDGTWQYSSPGFADGKNGQEWEKTGTGQVIVRSREAGRPETKAVLGPGSEAVYYEKIGEQLQPVYAKLSDGAEVYHQYGADKKLNGVILKESGRNVEYTTADGGKTWTEKGTGRVGTLELKQGIVPEFRASGEVRDVRDSQRPTDSTEPAEIERARITALQTRLGTMLEAIYQPKFEAARRTAIEDAQKAAMASGKQPDEKELQKAVEAAHKKVTEDMEAQRKALMQEQLAMLGAANPSEAWAKAKVTQQLYKDCVRWLENSAVPAQVQRLMDAQARELPAGSPQSVPKDEHGLFLQPDLFRVRAANGTLPKPDLGIPGTREGDQNPLQPPSEKDVLAIGRAMTWLSDAQKQVERERRDYELNIAMPRIIQANGLPPKWLEEAGRDPESKLPALREMVQLATTARNYTIAMSTIGLDKLGITEFPPGCKPVFENGKLVRVNLDMPKDLDMQNPANLRKIEQLHAWMEKYGARIDKAIETYAAEHPGNSVFYGEIEMKAKVRTDASGKPLEVFDPKDPRNLDKTNDPRSADFNLLSCDYQIRNVDGKVYIDYQVQPKKSEFYNYLNIGASNASQTPFVSTKGPYEPNDPVAIRDGSGKVSLILAKDLESTRTMQKIAYWGEKGLTLTMDVGMAVASIGTGGAAFAAGNTFKLATAAARFALAGSGFFLNNAWARTDETWSKVGEVRGALMVLDVTQGTVRHLAGGALKYLGYAGSAAHTADKLKDAAMASNWLVRNLYRAGRVGEVAMEVANVPYAPIVIKDIAHGVQVLNEQGAGNPFERAARMVKDGRDLMLKPLTPEEKSAQETEAAKRQLDVYSEQLSRGKDEAGQQQIRDIIARAKEALQKDYPAEKRAQFERDLLALVYGDEKSAGAKIASKESATNNHLTDAAARTFEGDVVASADVRAAAAAALLFMNKDKSGKDAIYATRTVTVPAHTMGYGEDQYTSPERTVTQSISRADLMARLKDDVCTTDSVARRVISGDLLVRAGERPPIAQANILRDVLSDPKATTADKVNAIAQLAPMINALQVLSDGQTMTPAERQNFIAQCHGVTAGDLQRAIAKLAGNAAEKDDLRALAAAVSHKLNSEFDPRAINTAVTELTKKFVEASGGEGVFRKQVIDELTRTATASGTDPLSRLRATLTLRDLGNLGGFTDNAAFNGQLLRSFDTKNPTVSQLALANLQVANPGTDISAADRSRVLNYLDEATNSESAALKLAIVSQLSRFAVTSDEVSKAKRYLSGLIDPTLDKSFARQSPELRAAAITALANMNAADMVPAITRFAAIASEQDARVRSAAVSALEKLKAPGMAAFVIETLRTETDPTIRAKLTNLRSQNERPIRNEAYLQQLQALQADLEQSQKNNYDDEAAHKWFESQGEFNLLTTKGYEAEYERRVTNLKDVGTFEYQFGEGSKGDFQERERRSLEQDRERQMWKLRDKASENTTEGHHARMILLSLVFKPAEKIHDGRNNDETSKARTNRYSELAATAIKQLCDAGSEVRGDFLKGIRQALRNEHLPASARIELIAALDKFVKNQPVGPSRALESFMADPKRTTSESVLQAFRETGVKEIPAPIKDALKKYETEPNQANLTELTKLFTEHQGQYASALYRQIASVAIAEGLKAQAIKLSDKNQAGYNAEFLLQKKMIEKLVEYQFRDAYVALEAYASNSHPDPEIKKIALEAVAKLRDRIGPRWDVTAPDTTTSARQRASNVEQVLGNGDVDDVAQALITAYKGMPIKDAADPRILAYQRALREVGLDKERPGEISRIDGTPKVRIAAARVILDRDAEGKYINQGFSDEDRREAIRAMAVIAAETVKPTFPASYVTEASEVLAAEAKRGDVNVLGTALRDLLLTDPRAAEKTITIAGRALTIRQLWLESFKADVSSLKDGTGTLSVPGATGPMQLVFDNGRLVSASEARSDGTQLNMRRAGQDLVIEHLRGNELVKAVPPKGRTYANVLNDEIISRGLPAEQKLALATRLLTDATVAASPAERDSCTKSLELLASNGTQEDRLAFARYLAFDGPMAADPKSTARLEGIANLARISAIAESPIKEQAEALLKNCPSADVAHAIKALTAVVTSHLRAVEDRNTKARELSKPESYPPKYREQIEAYMRATNQTGTPAPLKPDAVFVEQNLKEILRLSKQAGMSRDVAASLVEAGAAGAKVLDPNSATLGRLREEVNAATRQTEVSSGGANDAYIASLRTMLTTAGNDTLRLDVAELILKNKNVDRDLYHRALRATATIMSEPDRKTAERARDILLALPKDDVSVNNQVRLAILEQGQRAVLSTVVAEQKFFWDSFAEFHKRAGIDANDPVYKHAVRKANELSPEGSRVDTTDALKARISEVEKSDLAFDARSSFEKILQKRADEKIADDMELARARLRYVEFMRQHPKDDLRYRDARESFRQVELAVATLEKGPKNKELADALMLAVKLSDYNPSGRSRESSDLKEKRLAAAAEIYGTIGSASANHVSALGDLGATQSKAEDKLKTCDTITKLLESQTDDKVRANIIANAFRVVRSLTASGTKVEGGMERATQLLAEAKKLDLAKLSQAEMRALAETMWWAAREIDERGDSPKSHPFFEHSLAIMDKSDGIKDARYTDLMGYYATVVVKKTDPVRAADIEQQVKQLRTAGRR